MAAAHFSLISSLSFYGGDWCWGPRYLVTTTPILSLGLPLMRIGDNVRRRVARTLIGIGLLVQVAGLSMDHQGFFFAHNLPDWFWADPAANFRHSQLAYRVKELRDLFTSTKPRSLVPFQPGPYPTLPTYAIFGPNPRPSKRIAPEIWMKAYPIFYVPRPWPLWMPRLPVDMQPVPPLPTASLFAMAGLAGAILIRRGLGKGGKRNDHTGATTTVTAPSRDDILNP
jgi:hypothetical protein